MTYITQLKPVLLDDVIVLADPSLNNEKLAFLVDLIEGLRWSNPAIESATRLNDEEAAEAAKGAPPGMSESVWRVELKSRYEVSATLWIATSSQGLLTGLRFDVSLPSRLRDVEELVQCLRLLDAYAAVHLGYCGESITLGNIRDVASIYKILILLAVQDSLHRGVVSLTDRHCVETITPLSAGLSQEHLGMSFSLQELCAFMILRSDNTATDLVISAIGREAIERAFERAVAKAGRHRTPEHGALDWRMSSYIDRAWSLTPEFVVDLNCRRKQMTPVHDRGIGFFIPIDIVAAAMEMAATAAWHPWPAVPVSANIVFFKGGSAPGVQSGIWFGPEGSRTVAISANSPDGLFGLIEEMFLIKCGEVAFESVSEWLP